MLETRRETAILLAITKYSHASHVKHNSVANEILLAYIENAAMEIENAKASFSASRNSVNYQRGSLVKFTGSIEKRRTMGR
jgi:hypothetical protein